MDIPTEHSELNRGPLFEYRALQLLKYLRDQPQPYEEDQDTLAKASCISRRSIERYLRFLKATGKITIKYHQFRITGTSWANSRKIFVVR